MTDLAQPGFWDWYVDRHAVYRRTPELGRDLLDSPEAPTSRSAHP
jgi:hypothetical protein